MELKKEKIKISDRSITFIKKYMIEEFNISSPINEEMLINIGDKCFEYDEQLATKELHPDYVIEDINKCKEAGFVEAEIFNDVENYVVDYDDLNQKLGLIK